MRKACVAVFGVPEAATGTEKVVILAETRIAPGETHDALCATLRQATVSLLGAPADDVVLAPAHTVLKTFSGKIRRAASSTCMARAAGRSGENAAYVAWVWLAVAIMGALVLPACL